MEKELTAEEFLRSKGYCESWMIWDISVKLINEFSSQQGGKTSELDNIKKQKNHLGLKCLVLEEQKKMIMDKILSSPFAKERSDLIESIIFELKEIKDR